MDAGTATQALDLGDIAVAVHEAGHAVAAVRLAVEFRRVALLENDPEGRAGALFADPAENLDPMKELVVLLAGTVAEHLWTAQPLNAMTNGSGGIDFAKIDRLGAALQPDQADAVVARTHRLVLRNAGPIAAVAAELIHQRSLDQKAVKQVIHNVALWIPAGVADPSNRPRTDER